MDLLQKFYVTFGVQYAVVQHPVIPDAHPDGVLLIEAVNYQAARDKTQELIGQAYSMVEHEEEMADSWHFFTRGVTHQVDPTGTKIIPFVDDFEEEERLVELHRKRESE